MIVPSTECPLSATELEALRNVVDPLEESEDYGIGLYVATRALCVFCVIFLTLIDQTYM